MRKILPALALALVLLTGIAVCGAEALPAYAYPGTDPVEAALADYVQREGLGEGYLTEEGSVTIPAPVVVKTEETADGNLRVWANLWVLNYVQRDGVLFCISGGEMPCLMTLEPSGEGWTVAEVQTVGDGEAYDADMRRICGDDQALLDDMFASSVSEEPALSLRTRFVREYAEANGLAVWAWQDPYWDPVPLTDSEPITCSIENGAYTVRIPLRAGEPGAWQAETPEAPLTLVSAGEADGTFTAVFGGEGSGTGTAVLSHVTDGVCDQIQTFTLTVAEGQVTENTEGSYTGSPAENELAESLEGEWTEAETQFTRLTIRRDENRGFRAEIVSPMTHGAYTWTMTLRYDCRENALVYFDGARADLTPEEEAQPVFTDENCTGRLIPGEDGERLILVWHSDREGDEDVTFELLPPAEETLAGEDAEAPTLAGEDAEAQTQAGEDAE